jgi:hypothetical protein
VGPKEPEGIVAKRLADPYEFRNSVVQNQKARLPVRHKEGRGAQIDRQRPLSNLPASMALGAHHLSNVTDFTFWTKQPQ